MRSAILRVMEIASLGVKSLRQVFRPWPISSRSAAGIRRRSLSTWDGKARGEYHNGCCSPSSSGLLPAVIILPHPLISSPRLQNGDFAERLFEECGWTQEKIAAK